MLLKKRELLERANLFNADVPDASSSSSVPPTDFPGATSQADAPEPPVQERTSPPGDFIQPAPRPAPVPEDFPENEADQADSSVTSTRESLETTEAEKGMTPAAWLNQVFTEAMRLDASDIHIVPEKDYLSVRFRLNGLIHEVAQWGIEFHDTVLSRIKVISGMQVVEKNIPQDGHLELLLEGMPKKNAEGELQRSFMDLNFRVSTMPTINGEVAVLRALNKEQGLLSLESVGFSDKTLLSVKKILRRGHGVFLVTGHSGSGKTTTLYSILNYLNDKDKAIVTLEDPVEYHLPNVRQSQVSPQFGLSFNAGLKAILRQDPDMIMIGEIRDEETAETAMRLALVGRLVLTTLHTNSISGALVRLSEMDIERSIVSSALAGVMAERLVRKICDKCRAPAEPPYELLRMFNIEWTGEPVFAGRGCDACHHTGFIGRTGIFEVFEVTDEFRNLVIEQAPMSKLDEYIQTHMPETIRNDGFSKVRQGITTLEEVIQATI